MDHIRYVFQGSGTTFPVQIGCVRRLELEKKRVVGIAATSGGSIVGALLASGRDSYQISKLIKSFQVQGILDWHWPRFAGLLSNDMSIMKGKKITKAISSVLPMTFSDLEVPLTIYATDINTLKPVVFSVIDTPDVPVSLAVRASISIPLIFPPVKYGKYLLADGGLCNNFPMDYFGKGKNVVGVKVINKKKVVGRVQGFTDVIWTLIKAMLEMQENEYLDKDLLKRVIFAETYRNGLDFDLKDSAIDSMIREGYMATDKWLKGL